MPECLFHPEAAPTGGALHEDLRRRDQIEGPSDRRFGLIAGIVVGVVGAVHLARGDIHWAWCLAAAAVLAALALCRPAALSPLNRLWRRLGLLLSGIVSLFALALLFTSTIVPIGTLMRLCGRDPLRLQRNPAATSYWIERRPRGPPPEGMRNQF
jgi:hypothetical protein